MALCAEAGWAPRIWAIAYVVLALLTEVPPLAREMTGNSSPGFLRTWATVAKIMGVAAKVLIASARGVLFGRSEHVRSFGCMCVLVFGDWTRPWFS